MCMSQNCQFWDKCLSVVHFFHEFLVGCSTNCTATEKKTCVIFFFIGDKTVTIDAHPMQAVQQQYSIECTRSIGYASIVTVFLPLKRQTLGSKCCQLKNFICWASTKRYAHVDLSFFGPPEMGTHLELFLDLTQRTWWRNLSEKSKKDRHQYIVTPHTISHDITEHR